MRRVCSILFAALTASGAMAQDLVPALASCAKEKSPTSRLACFDALAAKRASPISSTVTSANSKWVVSSETSRIDDSKTVILRLQAENEITGWPRKSVTPSLVIRCKERHTDAYFVTGMSPMVEYGTDGATITLRIDKSPAFKLQAGKSTDGEALFLPSAVSQIKRMTAGSSLLFEFVPFNSSPQMATFQIAGLADALKPVREACKW
jgi:type VI secretion system protein VasI